MSVRTIKYLSSVIAVAVGLVLGGGLNLLLLKGSAGLLSSSSATEWLAFPDLLEPRHYVALFVAHAVSTFIGALAAYVIAARFRVHIAYAIGTIFLFTDLVMGSGSGAPAAFVASNLIGAYLPMCWLAIRIAQRLEQSRKRAATTDEALALGPGASR